MFVVVGENTKSASKTAGQSTKTTTDSVKDDALDQHWVVKSLVLSMSVWMVIAPVYAQITPDAGAKPANRPVIGVGTNNQGQKVPVVNIQTPVNGISHNIYSQMDVLNNGVVLNNSRTGATSNLVGSVGANPFLAKGEARLILNEVNSKAATRFEGNLEVAGQRADVIIANPAGINIKGGGFINANKAIFTTGKPQFNADGSIKQFVVDQGKVTVSANTDPKLGLGGNNNNANYVDIYARALELNAQLRANQDINVITGSNTISADLGEIKSQTSKVAAPALAIDIKSLGGMYANNIYLIGNEKGLGVSNAGTLQAVNNIVVTSAGKIENNGIISSTNKKGGVISLTTTESGKNSDININGSVTGYGLISADSGNDLNLNAKNITINYDATTKNSADLIVNAKGKIDLATGTKISNLSNSSNVYIDAKNINFASNSEVLSNHGSASINAKENLTAANTARLIAAADLNIEASKSLKLLGSTLQATKGSINLQSVSDATSMLQLDKNTIRAGKDLNIYGTGNVSLKDLNFYIVDAKTSTKDINVYSGKDLVWNNAVKALPQILGKVQLEAKNGLDLTGTTLHATDGITTLSDTLKINKEIKSNKGLDLTVKKDMNLNAGSKLSATGDVIVNSLQGNIQAESLKVDTRGKLTVVADKNINLIATQNNVKNNNGITLKTTDKTVLNADQGIVIGNAGDGKTVITSVEMTAKSGEIQLLAKNGIKLQANTDVDLVKDVASNKVIANKLNAKSIVIENKKENIDIKNTDLVSTEGKISVNNTDGLLDISNGTLKSKGNTELYAKDHLGLHNVTVNADQHIALNSKRDIYLNASNTPTGTVWGAGEQTNLTAKGVLSLTSAGNQLMQKSNLKGGAVLLEANHIYQKPSMVLNATGSDLLKNDKKLNSLNGDLTIQTRGANGLTIDPKLMTLSAVGDIELSAKGGALTLVGYGGAKGNGSEQVVKLNTANGGISLDGTKVDIQGSQLTAQKDIKIVSTKDDVLISGIKNNGKNLNLNFYLDKYSRELNEVEEIRKNFYKEIAIAQSDIFDGMDVDDVGWEYARSVKDDFAEISKKYNMKVFLEVRSDNKPYDGQFYKIVIKEDYSNKISNLIDEINFYKSEVNGYEHSSANITSNTGNINVTSAKGASISGSELIAKAELVNIEARAPLAQSYTSTTQVGNQQAKNLGASIIIDGTQDFYDKGNENGDNYSFRTLINPTAIEGAKGVNIKAIGVGASDNLVMQATMIKSQNGDVRIEANKNILFDAAIEQSYDLTTTTEKKKSWGGLKKKYITTRNEDNDVDAASVDVQAKNIYIESKEKNPNNSIDIYSGRFVADGGKVSIRSGGNLNFYTVEESSRSTTDVTKKSSFTGIKYNSSKTNSTRTQVSEIPATLKADYIGTKSGFDTRLEGTEFEYLKGATIEAGGKLELIAAKTTITDLLKKEKNSVVWQSMQDKGSITETAQLPQFNGPVLPTFKATGGLSVQIPVSEKDQNKVVLRNEILKLANQPGNDYLKELVNRKDVDWNTIILAQKDWDYKSQGLTGAGAAIIVIIVTIVTMGTGTAAAAGTAGAGAATGGTTVGLGASMLGAAGVTTTTVGGVTTITGISTLGAMANAAITSLATQASVGIINNGGDIGKTLKDLGSKDSVKNLVASVATAGLLSEVGTALKLKPDSTLFQDKLIYNFTSSVGSTLVQTAVKGGSLEDNLKVALLAGLAGTLQGELAGKIGESLDKVDPSIIEYAIHKIAHAAAGCATGAIVKQCEAGAIGAAVGEIVAGMFDKPDDAASQAEKDAFNNKVLATVEIVSGTVAAYAGYDVHMAALSANMAVSNNYLTSDDYKALKQEIAACKTDQCRSEKINSYKGRSKVNRAALEKACKDAGSKACSNHLTQYLSGRETAKQLGLNFANQNDFQYVHAGILDKAAGNQFARVSAAFRVDERVRHYCGSIRGAACEQKLKAADNAFKESVRRDLDILMATPVIGNALSMGEATKILLTGMDITGDNASRWLAAAEIASVGFAKKGVLVWKGAGNVVGKTCSFRGDMEVKTLTGYRPIQSISQGDWVYSLDEVSGQSSYKQVLAHYSNPYNETVYVSMKSQNGDEQTVVSNKIHPYFTVPKNEAVSASEGHIYKGAIEKGQWVDAENLTSGDQLLDSNNQWQEIISVTVKPEPIQAYNLTVDQTHTYFIKGLEKSNGVWVHNSCSNIDAKKFNGKILGTDGVQTFSTTVWKGNGKSRIDVENPAPGKRAGQLHYQDNVGNKYYYDPNTKVFFDQKTKTLAPKSVQDLLKNKDFSKGIDKALKYLGVTK